MQGIHHRGHRGASVNLRGLRGENNLPSCAWDSPQGNVIRSPLLNLSPGYNGIPPSQFLDPFVASPLQLELFSHLVERSRALQLYLRTEAFQLDPLW